MKYFGVGSNLTLSSRQTLGHYYSGCNWFLYSEKMVESDVLLVLCYKKKLIISRRNSKRLYLNFSVVDSTMQNTYEISQDLTPGMIRCIFSYNILDCILYIY